MTISYLVSTAGHAQAQNQRHPHSIKTIVQLIQDGAEEFGNEKVVGFTSLSVDGKWVYDRYSFLELLSLSEQIIASLRQLGVGPSVNNEIISLLFPTGLDFLVAWIALMRLGYGVVFIAPQCSPSAILHLLTTTSSTRLIHHPKYNELAQSTKSLNSAIVLSQLSTQAAGTASSPLFHYATIDPKSISHVFHSSGTSGNPKPIPNNHLQSVSVLPRRALPSYLHAPTTESTMPVSESATFTTTPLFHGGVSDLLRAWMARSMIYFYPTSDTPITADHVVGAITACQNPLNPLLERSLTSSQMKERTTRFKVSSFLSVPYILTILSEDTNGPAMDLLREMDLVSTGGAPLDKKVGDHLVDKGVNLVSRLGSSECGFLLSSHRKYDEEKDWEWLRNDSPFADALVFTEVEGEEMSDGRRYEMIVTNEWSSKAKSNREDGSYATGDLYQPHPTKRNVWKYVGRGDDVIVLSNGEKASPGPIESILRSSPHVSEALVVGVDRPQLGVILFPSSSRDRVEVLEDLLPVIKAANDGSPSFAQISPEMCLIVDSDKTTQLPKSSKGTVQRGLAYETFKEEIEKLYGSQTSDQANLPKHSVAEIERIIEKLITEIAGDGKAKDLESDTDLFSWGVNSLMATRLRSAIQTKLNTGGKVLPLNVVFERPSLSRLSHYIFNLQENDESVDDMQYSPQQLMEELVEKYSKLGSYPSQNNVGATASRGKIVVVTGGTGSLGSFLVDQLTRLPRSVIHTIICLVRAPDDETARRRIHDALDNRGLKADESRLEIFATDLAVNQLGLESSVYQRLSQELDIILHAAWPVHFASNLISFEESIKGLHNLLQLVSTAWSDKSRLYYCSSLASVLGRPPPSGTIYEEPSSDPLTASAVGYAQSKWVAEQLCLVAEQSMRGRIHVLRVGQLCGDTESAHWNEKEGWPLMIRTAQTTGCLPVLDENPSWLPVDLAARAVVDIVTEEQSNKSFIYHVAHPSTIEWHTILDGLRSAGLAFERVSPQIWIRRVEASPDDPEENPSKQMLLLWKAAYGHDPAPTVEPIVDTTHARSSSVTLREIQPVGAEHIGKTVEAWHRTGYLH